MGTLQPWIEQRRASGAAIGTINHGVQVVRRILNLAASEWMDEQGLTWLRAPAKIKLLPNGKAPAVSAQLGGADAALQRAARHILPTWPCSRSIPAAGLLRSAAFGGIGRSRYPKLGSSVFIVPGSSVKNGEERLVVLNRIAKSVIETRRGKHATHVFTFDGNPVNSMLNSAWKKARCRAGLADGPSA